MGASATVAINLDEFDGKLYEGVDLVGYHLTGQVRLVHDLSSHNFISCVFDKVFANDIDLTRCDFKDVLIKDSHFRRCTIQAATHTTTVYLRTTFEECDFTNAAQTNCEFREVTFTRSQLSNLLTKSSRLYECNYIECATKTHVFEGNVFLRCHFSRTDLEVRTIVSNFGLKLILMDNCRIRNTRISEDFSYLEPEALQQLAQEQRDDPLTLLSILYFLNGTLIGGGDEVDSAFNIKSWARLARQPASFAQLIELLAEFMMNTFDDNEVDMHKILMLHDITRQIVVDDKDDSAGNRLRLTFGGIHLALSRLVEDYLFALSELCRRLPKNIRVLANGPPSKAYYETALGALLDHCGVGVAAARPHNSPTDLEFFELLPGGRFYLIAALLATFVRFELRAACHAETTKPRIAPTKGRNSSEGKALIKDPEFFQLTSGMTTETRRTYELRVKSLIPTTSIIVDLKLSVSTQFIRKIRDVVIRILQE
jgi:uncharacterized protein YjbI with pentapeptide repeats